MGYGCWNASGLDPDSDPKTITIDYAYTSEEEFREMQATSEIGEEEEFEDFANMEASDEFHNLAVTICGAGKHLAELGVVVQTFGYRDEHLKPAWAHYGDRYQYLKPAFYLGKVGAWWQEEPFMGHALCLVVAPLYHLDEGHDVWTLDEGDFRRQYHMSVEKYKEAAERQAALVTDFMLAYLESEMSSVSCTHASVGSGYCRSYFKPEEIRPLKSATTRLFQSVMTPEQRQQRAAYKRARRSEVMKARAAEQLATVYVNVL